MLRVENSFKRKLDQGEIAFGMQLRSASARMAEFLSLCGFDYIYIENEHYLYDDMCLEDIFRACEVSGCAPIVRLCDCSKEKLTQIAEAGAKGIIIPHLESKEEASDFVNSIKFPPIGLRSSIKTRAAFYGLNDKKTIRDEINNNILAIGMIESVNAINHLDEILDAGIDAIRIGFNDLSQDMKHIGEPRHPEVIEITKKAIEIANRRNVSVGCTAESVEDVKFFKQIGFTHFTLSSDIGLLSKILPNMLDECRNL